MHSYVQAYCSQTEVVSPTNRTNAYAQDFVANRTNAYAQDFVANDTLLLPILKTFVPDYRTYLVKLAIMLSRPARLLYTASLLQLHTAP